ncbi:MAG: hypothetical protein ACRCXZ_06875 [Patescibacteria group bacterium]
MKTKRQNQDVQADGSISIIGNSYVFTTYQGIEEVSYQINRFPCSEETMALFMTSVLGRSKPRVYIKANFTKDSKNRSVPCTIQSRWRNLVGVINITSISAI